MVRRIFSSITSLFVPTEKDAGNLYASKTAQYICIPLLIFFVLFYSVSFFIKTDLSYTDTSQQNIPPSFSLCAHPKYAEHISAGPFWNIAVSDGRIKLNGEVPFDTDFDFGSDNTNVCAGYDHALILKNDGSITAVGNGIYGECSIPKLNINSEITAFSAGYHVSYIALSDGSVHAFGIEGSGQIFEGSVITKIQPLYLGGALLLDNEGTVHCTGSKNLPKELDGLKNVSDIAATNDAALILNKDGSISIYQITKSGKYETPLGKYTVISGGTEHFAAIDTDGNISIFSDKQKTLRSEKAVSAVSCGGYQTFLIYDDSTCDAIGKKAYPLGTDQFGRDMLPRLLAGGRIELTIALLACAISTVLGTVLGTLSGYKGGVFDLILMRITEITGSLPLLPFVMLISAFAVNLEQNSRTLILILMLGLLGWPNLAKLVRAQTLSVRESDYILSANAMGINSFRIACFHIAPNLLSTILVNATLLFSRDMLTQTTLSYLGLGVTPPYPTWGNMLSAANSSNVIRNFPWQWIFPAIMIALCVITINALGEWLTAKYEDK